MSLRVVLRDAVRVDLAQVRLLPAVRGGLGVTLPLALGTLLGQPGWGLGIAIGALNVAFCDQPGPYRGRARRMLLATSGGGLSVFVGAVTGGVDPLAVGLTAVWGLASGLLVALGPAVMQVGLTCLALLVVFSGHPMSPADALGQALLVLLGGLLQTVLAVLPWPVRPRGPERAALARLFRELAAATRPPARPGLAPPITAEMNEVSASLADLSAADPEAEALRSLLTEAERIRLEVLALHDSPEPAVEAVLCETATLLAALADALRRDRPPAAPASAAEALDRIEAHAADLRRRAAGSPVGSAVVAHVEALAGQLRAVVAIAAEGATAAAAERATELEATVLPARPDPLEDALATLRANLTLDSAVCRHAVRLAGCLAVADLLGRGLHLPWPYWVPLTVAVVLRPEFGTTFSRGLARVVGTFVGLAFATLLVQAPLGGAPAHVALVGVLVLGTRIIGPANFGLSAVTLSSLVVVLLTLAGDPPQATIVARGQDTAIGGALALAAYASWPTWERHRLLATLADLLEAYRRYFQAVLAGYLDPDNASAHALAETRQTARLARTNALSSLGRLGAEPAASRQLLGQAEALLASSHRFVRAVMALEAALYHPGGVLAPPSLHALAADVDATLSILGQRLRDPSTTDLPASLPDLRADERALAHALAAEHGPGEARGVLAAQADRIANSLSSMVHVLAAPDAPREQPDNTQRTPVLMATSDR